MSLYKYMGNTIGDHSHDWYTFKLFRKRKDLKIRRYPGTIGLSTAVLMDLVRHDTRIIIVYVDQIPCFRTDPNTWLTKGTVDKLTPDQDPHAFLHLDYFFHFENAYKLDLKHNKKDEESHSISDYLKNTFK